MKKKKYEYNSKFWVDWDNEKCILLDGVSSVYNNNKDVSSVIVIMVIY